MSADGDMLRSIEGVAKALVAHAEAGDRIDSMLEMFRDASRYLELCNQERLSFLFGDEEDEAAVVQDAEREHLHTDLFDEVTMAYIEGSTS